MEDWKKVAGSENWHNLLTPLNGDLRNRIVQCGERVQAIYDSIDDDTNSPKYGLPKYSEQDFFSQVGPDKNEQHKLYKVEKYIYALADVVSNVDWIVKDRSVWMGYVAVSTEERKAELKRKDILICWRGTILPAEWLKDLETSLVSASIFRRNREFTSSNHPYVHNGFYSLYTSLDRINSTYNKSSARDQVLKAVRELVDQYGDEEISITVTGHSLGAALATLNAADLVANGYNKPTGSTTEHMVTAFAFSSPMVGNRGFKYFFEGLSNLHLLQIRHAYDIVPELPLVLRKLVYLKVGYMLEITTTGKTFWSSLPLTLFPSKMMIKFHSLKHFLEEIKGRQPKPIDELQPNLAIEQQENGEWKLFEVPADRPNA